MGSDVQSGRRRPLGRVLLEVHPARGLCPFRGGSCLCAEGRGDLLEVGDNLPQVVTAELRLQAIVVEPRIMLSGLGAKQMGAVSKMSSA